MSGKPRTNGEGETLSPERISDLLKLGEQQNKLLKALLSHPKFNRSDPAKSPKPLFFVADFVRRTYINYVIGFLPREAVMRSSRFANEYVFGYPDSNPLPTDPADEYLNNPKNWIDLASIKSIVEDVVSRNMTICMCITDEVRGPMMTQGRFDWVSPVNIKAMAEEMMRS